MVTRAVRGQATMEMAVAMICTFALLLGCVKIFLFMNERIIKRQMSYERSRAAAASTNVPKTFTDQDAADKAAWNAVKWNEPTEKLRIYNESQ